MTARRSLSANFLSVLLGQLGTWSLTAVTVALLPRYLGPEQLGDVGVGVTFTGLVAVLAGLGMSALVIREVARGADRDGHLAATAVAVSFALGVVGAIAAYMVALATGLPDSTTRAVALCGLAVPFTVATAALTAVLQGHEIMRPMAALDVASKLVVLCLTLVVIRGDLGVDAYLIGTAAISALTMAAILVVARSAHSFAWLSISARAAWRLATTSLPFLAINLIWAAYTAIPVLLLIWLAAREDVGIFSAPMRIFGTLLFVPVALTTVVYPRLAALHGRDGEPAPGERDFASFAADTLRLSLVASALMAVAAVGLSDDVLVRVLGDDFSKSGPVVVILALSLFPTALSVVCSRVAFASDRQRSVAVVGLAAAAGQLALGAVLVPIFDAAWGNAAMGAAIALLAAEFGQTVGMASFLPAEVRSPALRRFVGKTVAALALAVASVGLLVPLTGSLPAAATGCVIFVVASSGLGVLRPLGALRLLRTRHVGELLGSG